jgi:hypothetical protein
MVRARCDDLLGLALALLTGRSALSLPVAPLE